MNGTEKTRTILSSILISCCCMLSASNSKRPEQDFRVLYKDAEFWHLSSINQQFDWANEQKEEKIRKFWLEEYWMYRVPEKLGGTFGCWEDSPHYNYVRSCSIELIEIYHKEHNDKKALELYLWLKNLGMLMSRIDDGSFYIPQKYRNAQFWDMANIGNRFNWLKNVESKIDQVFWLEQIIFHYLPPEYGEPTLWREEGFEDSPHANYIRSTGEELKKLRVELAIDGKEQFKMYR